MGTDSEDKQPRRLQLHKRPVISGRAKQYHSNTASSVGASNRLSAHTSSSSAVALSKRCCTCADNGPKRRVTGDDDANASRSSSLTTCSTYPVRAEPVEALTRTLEIPTRASILRQAQAQSEQSVWRFIQSGTDRFVRRRSYRQLQCWLARRRICRHSGSIPATSRGCAVRTGSGASVAG